MSIKQVIFATRHTPVETLLKLLQIRAVLISSRQVGWHTWELSVFLWTAIQDSTLWAKGRKGSQGKRTSNDAKLVSHIEFFVAQVHLLIKHVFLYTCCAIDTARPLDDEDSGRPLSPLIPRCLGEKEVAVRQPGWSVRKEPRRGKASQPSIRSPWVVGLQSLWHKTVKTLLDSISWTPRRTHGSRAACALLVAGSGLFLYKWLWFSSDFNLIL